MSLKFIGRLGQESYKEMDANGKPVLDKDGKEIYKKRPQQQFKSGIIKVKEEVKGKKIFYEAVLDSNGNPQFDAKGGKIVKPVEKEGFYVKEYAFKVKDIGKKFDFANEDAVLKKYPVSFTKG